MIKQRNLIGLLIGIIIGLVLSFILIGSGAIARTIKEYAGEMVCTSYHVSDNTPRGSRATSTGARATEYHTIAVDMYDPAFPYGTRLYVEGFGYGIVQDCGNLARYGTHLDLFTAEGDGFKEHRNVWVVRPETKAEKMARKVKKKAKQKQERQTKQKKPFRLVYDPTLLPWQIRTDKDIIPSGTVLVEWDNMTFQWLDVVDTEKNIGHVIKIGNQAAVMCHTQIRLQDVIEEAVG